MIALHTALGLLVSCSGGGGSKLENPCGLMPTGTVTDGTFSGSFQFSGVSTSFPVEAVLSAANRSLSASLVSRDAVETFSGTLSCTIDSSGAITGTYSQTGASSGKHVTGTVKGVTDNQQACGTWSNSAGQEGTWQLARKTTGTTTTSTSTSTSSTTSKFTALPPCQTSDDCSQGTCFDCGGGTCRATLKQPPGTTVEPLQDGRCWQLATCSTNADCTAVGTKFGVSAQCSPSLGSCQPGPATRVSPDAGVDARKVIDSAPRDTRSGTFDARTDAGFAPDARASADTGLRDTRAQATDAAPEAPAEVGTSSDASQPTDSVTVDGDDEATDSADDA